MKVNVYKNDNTPKQVNEGDGKHFGYSYKQGDFSDTEGGDPKKGTILKAIPSFAICALISWPLTVLMGIGAVHARLMRKWDDKNKFLQTLDPRYWVDYVVGKDISGIKQGSRDSSDKTPKKEDVEKFGKTVAASAGGAAAALAVKSVLDSSSLSEDEINKAREYVMQTVKDKECKPRWVYLSNGEVLRMHTPDNNSAKALTSTILEKTTNEYAKSDQNIKNGAALYAVYFDDGEIALQSGTKEEGKKTDREKDKKLVAGEALKTRQAITDQFNKQIDDAGAIRYTELSDPQVVKVVRKKSDGMPTPKVGSYIVKTEMPRVPKTELPKLDAVPYQIGNMDHYVIGFGPIIMNMPAKTKEEAVKIFKTTFKDSDLFTSISTNAGKKGRKCYKISMNDGDIYTVFADDINTALDIARGMESKKCGVIEDTLAEKDSIDYIDFMEAYTRDDGTNLIMDVKSCPDKPMSKNPDFGHNTIKVSKKDSRSTRFMGTDKY